MYTVIGHSRSRTLRVICALEEMGLAYTLDPQKPHSPAVIAHNPSGRIPVLVGPEGAISDSVAILTWLADRHGQLTHPAGSIARARQDAVTNYIITEVDAALWLYAKHSFALPEDLRVPAVKPTAAREYARAMAYLDAQKGDAPFLAGDRLTIPDIVLSHCAGWGLKIGFPLPGGDFGAFLKSLRKRPAIQRAMATAEEAPTLFPPGRDR